MGADDSTRYDAGLMADDPEAAALLACLRQHVFDPGLDVGSMLRVCGASRRVRDRLAAVVGPLKAWITARRMEEAERLVRKTKMPIAAIRQRVGYGQKKTFGRAFRKAFHMSPSEMRRQARVARLPQAVAPETTTTADQDAMNDTQLPRRVLASRLRRQRSLGLLDPGRAAELRSRLCCRHPVLEVVDARPGRGQPIEVEPEPGLPRQDEAAPQQHPIVLTPTGDALEERAAAAVLGEIIDGTEADLRFALLHGVRFGNVGAYRHLQRVCLRLVPHDAGRALVLAELAVRMIDQHRELMGEEADAWQALAWIFLGRIQVAVGDCGGAEQSLGFARAEVVDWPSWVEIEARQVEGMVRQRQRRYDEAERALDRAVELSRALPPAHPERGAVVLQRLELASILGDVEAGLAFAEALEALIEAAEGEDGLTLWHGFVAYHRAKAHAAAGHDGCAERFLHQTVNDIAADPTCDIDPRLGLLFTFALHELARVADRGAHWDDSASLLRTAIERYRWLEVPVFEATTEAELAVLCALRGDWPEARQLASASAAFLDALPFHREAWTAARRLRRLAGYEGEVGEHQLTDLLSTLRSDLDRVAWEIVGSQALPAARARRAERPDA